MEAYRFRAISKFKRDPSSGPNRINRFHKMPNALSNNWKCKNTSSETPSGWRGGGDKETIQTSQLCTGHRTLGLGAVKVVVDGECGCGWVREVRDGMGVDKMDGCRILGILGIVETESGRGGSSPGRLSSASNSFNGRV